MNFSYRTTFTVTAMEIVYEVESTGYLYFYNGQFSNFSRVSFNAMINGVMYTFNCGEQYIMARKAKLLGDEKSFNSIMNCSVPKTIKSLGRKITPWNQQLWDENIHDIAYQLCLARCVQDRNLTSLGKVLYEIRSKHDKLIVVEASPTDRIWGSGQNSKSSHETFMSLGKYIGDNILGNAFSQVADELYEEINL